METTDQRELDDAEEEVEEQEQEQEEEEEDEEEDADDVQLEASNLSDRERDDTIPSQATSRNEERTRDDEELEEYTQMLAVQMAPNMIKEAERCGDRRALAQAINRFERLGEDAVRKYGQSGVVTDKFIERAKQNLAAVDHFEEELKAACEQQDAAEIHDVVKRIRERGIHKFLRSEIQEALLTIDKTSSSASRRQQMPILAMDKRTMTELKHYANPSPLVHRVMQAALLLLGVDEGRTAKWSQCQTLCTPDGEQGLNRRLMQFNVERVHPFIATRARNMMRGIQLIDVQRASPGAATFYVWVQGSLTELEKLGTVGSQQSADDTTPSTPRQAESSESVVKERIRKEKAIFAQADKKNAKPSDKSTARRNFYQLSVI